MKPRTYVLAATTLAAAVLLVVGAVLTLNPPTITGDRAADDACAAAVEWIGPDFETPDPDRPRRLLGPDKAGYIAEIAGHTKASSIEAIRRAGEGLERTAYDPGLFGGMRTMTALVDLAQACRDAGWTPQEAGLVPADK